MTKDDITITRDDDGRFIIYIGGCTWISARRNVICIHRDGTRGIERVDGLERERMLNSLKKTLKEIVSILEDR